MPFDSLLSDEYSQILEEERTLLWDLHDEVLQVEGAQDRVEQLRQVIQHLDEFFLLVVVGEFNSGKSTFINALLGQQLLEEGPTPTTREVGVLQYGETLSRANRGDHILYRFPLELLRYLNIVDTPGTNSVIRRHQKITLDFIPRADLVLFVLSADRPLTESERALLEIISQEWRRKVVFLLNKIDTKTPEEVEQILAYLREECRHLLALDALIFPLSAKEALAGKTLTSPTASPDGGALLERSGLPAVEEYITHTLNQQERLALKLLNPLHTAETIRAAVAADLEARLKVLEEDLKNIERITQQLEQAEVELQENHTRFLLEIQNALFQVRQEANQFIDDFIRLRNLRTLMSRQRIEEEFNQKVVGEATDQIEDTLTKAADWLVRRSMQLWNDTLDFYHGRMRRPEYEGKILGEAGRGFVYDRERIYEGVIRAARAKIAEFDYPAETRRIRQRFQDACLEIAGLGVGALGLGALLTALFSGLLWDITGVLAASMVAALSFYILPRKRRQARLGFEEKSEALVKDLQQTIAAQFDAYIRTTLEEIKQEVISPFARFCRSEYQQFQTHLGRLQALGEKLGDLERRIAR